MAIAGWIVWLSLFGALDALYTALQQRFKNLFEFCFTTRLERTGCDEILHSRHARIFVVPNSWLGIASYLLLTLLYAYTTYHVLGAIIATAGLAISYYLLYVQAFVLKRYCIFCLASTLVLTIITVLAWHLV